MRGLHQIRWLRTAKRRSVTGPAVGAALLVILGLLPPAFAGAMEIAILQSSDIAAYREAVAGFKSAGPGNALYTEYNLQGDLESGKKLARKVRASDASLVLAVGLKAALAAKQQIVDIPIVYMMILDPLKHQLSAPNIAGTMLEVPINRQLEIIRTFFPNLNRLGIMYNPDNNHLRTNNYKPMANGLSFALQEYRVENEKGVPQQLRSLLAENDALWLIPDPTVLTNDSIRFILDTALERHVPVIGFSSEFTRLGALMSISVNYNQVGRETAQLATRILNQEIKFPSNPAPIQRLKISVNLKTAQFLGIEIPKELNKIIDETY
ncbi:ABC transporter substrate-binding protein [Petrachloros mirabilis]